MARNFKELQAKMDPERRARVERRVQVALKAMPLEGLRDARQLTQAQFAQVLQVSQGAVSKVERRTDMYISTLAQLRSRHRRRSPDSRRLSGRRRADRPV